VKWKLFNFYIAVAIPVIYCASKICDWIGTLPGLDLFLNRLCARGKC